MSPGSRSGRAAGTESQGAPFEVAELWQQGRFPIGRIMSHYDFDEIDRAARDAEDSTVIKPVLRF